MKTAEFEAIQRVFVDAEREYCKWERAMNVKHVLSKGTCVLLTFVALVVWVFIGVHAPLPLASDSASGSWLRTFGEIAWFCFWTWLLFSNPWLNRVAERLGSWVESYDLFGCSRPFSFALHRVWLIHARDCQLDSCGECDRVRGEANKLRAEAEQESVA